jgi:hypothetical protein
VCKTIFSLGQHTSSTIESIKELSTSSTNADTAMQHPPERTINRKLLSFLIWWTTIFLHIILLTIEIVHMITLFLILKP